MVQKAVQLELRLAVGMTSHGSRRMASASACVLQVSATVASAWNFVQKPRVFAAVLDAPLVVQKLWQSELRSAVPMAVQRSSIMGSTFCDASSLQKLVSWASEN